MRGQSTTGDDTDVVDQLVNTVATLQTELAKLMAKNEKLEAEHVKLVTTNARIEAQLATTVDRITNLEATTLNNRKYCFWRCMR